MTELVITRGYPASGKSTFAKRLGTEPGWARVCRDDLRAMLFNGEGGRLSHDQENHVSVAEHAQVEALLKAGRSVVVDAMHLRLRFARAWADLAFSSRPTVHSRTREGRSVLVSSPTFSEAGIRIANPEQGYSHRMPQAADGQPIIDRALDVEPGAFVV